MSNRFCCPRPFGDVPELAGAPGGPEMRTPPCLVNTLKGLGLKTGGVCSQTDLKCVTCSWCYFLETARI